MTGEQLHNPKGFDSASNNTTMMKDGAGSVLWTPQTDLPQALNIVSPQSAPPTENSGDVYIMDTTGTAYDINTITWQSGNTIRIAFNGSPDLSAVAADDYFVTSGNANSSNDGTFQISAVNDGSDYIDIINLNRSDATDDEATDAVGTGYYTLEEWDGVSKNMHVRFDGTSWISITPSAGYTCYDITSGNILIFNGTDWSTTITTSGSSDTLQTVITAGSTYTGSDAISMITTSTMIDRADTAYTAFGGSSAGTGRGSTYLTPTDARLRLETGIGVYSEVNLTSASMLITDLVNTKGLEYAADYSANYTARSLVDKAYADALVAGLGTLALVGTYTDNYVPAWNATTNTLESGIIYDNGTAIGIGTASIDADIKLQVEGSGATKLKIESTTTTAGLEIHSDTGTDNTKWSIYADPTSNKEFRIYDMTNTADRLVIQSDGEVQIGNYLFNNQQTVVAGQDNYVLTYDNATGKIGLEQAKESLIIAVSDETTALTTGTAKITFRMPYAFTLTDVRASLTTAGSTSGTTTIDINESGTSILSTKLTIDNTEKTSTTAATAVVISDSALADDAEITIDIDAVSGAATEAGLKVYLIGNRT